MRQSRRSNPSQRAPAWSRRPSRRARRRASACPSGHASPWRPWRPRSRTVKPCRGTSGGLCAPRSRGAGSRPWAACREPGPGSSPERRRTPRRRLLRVFPLPRRRRRQLASHRCPLQPRILALSAASRRLRLIDTLGRLARRSARSPGGKRRASPCCLQRILLQIAVVLRTNSFFVKPPYIYN